MSTVCSANSPSKKRDEVTAYVSRTPRPSTSPKGLSNPPLSSLRTAIKGQMHPITFPLATNKYSNLDDFLSQPQIPAAERHQYRSHLCNSIVDCGDWANTIHAAHAECERLCPAIAHDLLRAPIPMALEGSMNRPISEDRRRFERTWRLLVPKLRDALQVRRPNEILAKIAKYLVWESVVAS